MYIYIYIYIYTYIHTYTYVLIVAIFYPFGRFREIDVSLLSLQKQPNTAPNLFQRGVEYGEYATKGKGKRIHKELFVNKTY